MKYASLLLAGLVALAITGGCREWRSQQNEYRTQRNKAGALIGKSEGEVIKALGKPSARYGQQDSPILEYSYVDRYADTMESSGLEKPASAAIDGRMDPATQTVRLFFKDGKLEAVSGN